MARISAGISEALPRDRLDAITQEVRREQAVAVRSLGLGKLARSAEAELLGVLGRAGLEHTGTMIRVPLREQLRAVVGRTPANGISEAALTHEIKGARSAAELKLTLRGLIEEGVLAKVVGEGEPRLSLRDAQLLTNAELDQLALLAERLGTLAKATKTAPNAARPTLPRRALAAPLAALSELAKAREATDVSHALRAAFLVAPATSGLIRVPDVIRALEQLHPRSALLAATNALARTGVLELRPEASITRIGDEDRARCPVGLDGTPLSYARIKLSPERGQP